MLVGNTTREIWTDECFSEKFTAALATPRAENVNRDFGGLNEELAEKQLRSRAKLSTRSVLGKCVYLVTLAMSLFDLQDVCMVIGSIETLDLPMVVDVIGIYGLKGPYRTLTTTNWFLQALSVIPRGSWGDVARRSYHDPLGKSGIVIPEPQWLWAHD
ncbi:plasma membrane ATPase 1-like [Dorcoceras hygrometricum]|uniref:Plasma membrane ATPase 1-like n=1 Tax=Dorcoceras hygrometricum TaxID=472368 RepID=A0A2Z7AJ57_9LAMI|nr:plasma membrane ATPase 1-like [Dorcoceras hygrometricum]